MGFDGSSIQGYARIDESDMIAKLIRKPSRSSLATKRERGGPGCLQTSTSLNGTPYKGDPRWVLKGHLKRLRKKVTPFTSDLSWSTSILKEVIATEILDKGGYLMLTPLMWQTSSFRRETRDFDTSGSPMGIYKFDIQS